MTLAHSPEPTADGAGWDVVVVSGTGRRCLFQRWAPRRAKLIPRVVLSAVIMSLVCCGCRSVALSEKDTQAITSFIQKQTGESVVALRREADGDVAVETDITGRGLNSVHLWLLKRAPLGWRLIEQGILTL